MTSKPKRKITDFFGMGQGAKRGPGAGAENPSPLEAQSATPSIAPEPQFSVAGLVETPSTSCSSPSHSVLGVGLSLELPLLPAVLGDGNTIHESSSVPTPLHPALQINDIGYYVRKERHEIDDITLKQLLENPWMPPKSYSMPFSVHRKQGRDEKRFVRHEHLEEHKWLVLSHVDQGLYCKYCPFFVPGSAAGRNPTPLRQLVKEPLKKFSKLLGKDGAIEHHSKNEYHVGAVQAAKDFLRVMENPDIDVSCQMDSYLLMKKKENRKRLLIALQNVEFLGRQGLAFRGHKENSFYLKGDPCDPSQSAGEAGASDSGENKGNFLELMKFRKECGDQAVINHFATASDRNRFTSKIVQNDLIEACGKDIITQIRDRVKESKYYSILFDETTDVAHVSELSFSVRYPHLENKKISGLREDFLEFADPRKVLQKLTAATNERNDDVDEALLTDDDSEDEMAGGADDDSIITLEDEGDSEQALIGVNLGKVAIHLMNEHGLDPHYCVGIGTDGCAVNTSDLKGAVQEIRKIATNAERSPCFNHALNLSISKSSSVPSVQKGIVVMKEVGSFFRSSSKKHRLLKVTLQRTIPKLCETRWVERHTAVLFFFDNFHQIISTLELVSKWKDTKTATKATSLIATMLQSEFIVTLVCLRDILSATVSLSRLLQKESLELPQASDALQDTLSILEEKRRASEEVFAVLFSEAVEVASKIEVEITRPRIAQRGRHPTSDAESFYRQSIFNAILDSVIEDLKVRLSPEVLGCYNLNVLLPNKVLSNTDTLASQAALIGLAAKYANLLKQEQEHLERDLRSEWALWRARWLRVKNAGKSVPSSVLEALDVCDEELYPNIRQLLFVLAALPSSVATAERSFSTLRRLKTWLRSTMCEVRLNGLALLTVHRDIPINQNRVIDSFSQKNKKRITQFIL